MLAPVKFACQVLSGKGPGLDEACLAAAGRQPGEVKVPFGDGHGINGVFVTDLGVDPEAALAERISEAGSELEARSVPPPVYFEIPVPPGAKPGESISATGPNGPVTMKLHENAVKRGSARFALKPEPRYLVEVPEKAGPGWTLRFKRDDTGEEVAVTVPPGKYPGDEFEVAPPALMVEVPEGAQPGDAVKFCHQVQLDGDTRSGGCPQIFRAVVPKGYRPKQYFVAIIPPPDKQGNC